MGGIAAIAKAAGHKVTGSDRNVYPPMSTQLRALGIELVEGFEAAQLDLAPDVVVVGNVMTRGVPVIEALLDRGLPYASGPEWLAREVLKDRWVIAVAGTHGKTTTTSLVDLDPGIRRSVAGLPDRRRTGELRYAARASARRRSSSSRRTNTTRRSSTSARSSCTTVRARWCSTISSSITRTSIRTWPRSSGSSITWCAPCPAPAASSGMPATSAWRRR